MIFNYIIYLAKKFNFLFKRLMSDLNTEEKNDLENKIINNDETKVNDSDNNKELNNIKNAKIEDDEDEEDDIIENSFSVNKIYITPRIENVEKDNIIEEPELINNVEKNNQFDNNILNTEFNDNSFFIHCRNCMKIISIEESKYKFFIIRKDYLRKKIY